MPWDAKKATNKIPSDSDVVRVLKRDALGRVELVHQGDALAVRRVASGGGFPGSGPIARLLLARERRALERLAGMTGVCRLLDASADGRSLLRSFVPGRPLCRVEELPRDFFERLEEVVRTLHERGVCHNDLHKEANVLVGEDGRPALVDFQLASVHGGRGRTFAVRAREDLRHVWKHRSYYYRALGEADPLGGVEPRRSFIAATWRRIGKPLYRTLTRALPRRWLASGEERRGPDEPWPRWSAAVGPLPSGGPPEAPRYEGNSPGAPSRPC